MKPCLILVTGLPASGKSGFSSYAGDKLGLPVLEKDHYKEILFDDIGFKSREEKVKLGTAAMNIMYDQAGRLLKMGSDGILTSELLSTDAGVLHVTPFHSYPSGVTASASKRTEYLAWAKRTGGYIVEDNYDSELTVSAKNEDTLFSLSGGRQVIYLNTFSRTIAPSMRVGYLVLPESLLSRFEDKLGFYSCTVPVFEQYVLAQLICDGSFERHINRIRRQRRKEK